METQCLEPRQNVPPNRTNEPRIDVFDERQETNMTIEKLDSQPGYLGPPADWPIAPETWWKMRAIIIEWLQSGDDEPDEQIEPDD